jgi:hypothetical protein
MLIQSKGPNSKKFAQQVKAVLPAGVQLDQVDLVPG